MENNIDKILRNALENHEEMPPSESWTHIHTEISKQHKRVLTPVLVGLFLGFLLISGVGITYFYTVRTDDKLVISSSESKALFTPKNIKDYVQKQVPQPLSVSPQMTSLKLSVTGSPRKTTAKESQNLEEKPSKSNSTQEFSKVEDIIITNSNLVVDTKINEIQPVAVLAKSYVATDLSERMNEALIAKIDENYLEEKFVKIDSILDEGKKRFSLKHPIINFRLGMYNTSLSIDAKQGGENPFNSNVINPNSIYGFSGIFGMAWKLNKKSRVSVNFKLVSYSAVNAQSKSGAAYIDPLSPTNKPSGTFKYNPSKHVHEYLTPFGYVTQPINPNVSYTPKDFDVYFGGSTTNWQIGLNYEYDLVAFRHKKGGIPAIEIYGLGGINMQGIIKYKYNVTPFKNYNPLSYTYINYESYTQTSLRNGSPIVFGYNTGLGIRFQLSKRFGLNILGNYESNINSWVQDLPFTTRLSVLSVESGFFVNL